MTSPKLTLNAYVRNLNEVLVNTTLQNLKSVIEQRLRHLLMQNPLQTDFQKHYEEIVDQYNRERIGRR